MAVFATHPAARGSGSPARRALVVAALCLAGLVITWLVAAFLPAARMRDAAALQGFVVLDRPVVNWLSHHVLTLINPLPSSLFAAAAMIVAVRRGRRRLAALVPVILLGSVGSAEILKPLLAHPHDVVLATRHVADASWPSGHATEAIAMALCAVLVVPARLRPRVATAGGLFAVAVGFSLLTQAWHMPSDVLGGFLLGGLWVAVAVAFLLGTGELRVPSAGRPRGPADLPAVDHRHPWARVAGVLTLAAVLLTAARAREIGDFAAAHRSVVAAAAAIGVLALALTAGLAGALRR